MIYLITGKAGAGKSHYAMRLKEELELEGKDIEWLDGDIFREQTGNNDYSIGGRRRNLMDAAILAMEYERLGKSVILSFVAPKTSLRDEMRSHWNKSILIYIPGGTLWEGTSYEPPREHEMNLQKKD